MKRENQTLIESLEKEVVLNEVSKKMSEKELLTFVVENIDNEDIKSKNGMLKHLRSEGLSCSMDRVFKMYVLVEKEKNKGKKEEPKVEEPVSA